MKFSTRRFPDARRGNILVLSCVFMAGALALLAFAIDLGYLAVARTELQRSADAAAMAAAWELVDDDMLVGTAGTVDLADEINSARSLAITYGGLNPVCTTSPAIDLNSSNLETGDVVLGYIANPFDSTSPMVYDDENFFNAVRVRVRRTTGKNGQVPFFFARILGLESTAAEAEATAALLNNIGGFQAPGNGSNLQMLPFALDLDTWNGMLVGGGTDNWRWNAALDQVEAGPDYVREVNLYPQGTGSPGNRGTVDIGGSNNSTNDIARQITDGISPQDLIDLGKPLKLDSDGELGLNGDTGISAGVKDELASIKGQPRIIPIFSQVSGPGNNAEYTIVAWAGVRIMDVNLTGSMSDKRVIIQPAKIFVRGAQPGGNAVSSYFVYSPVWLVR